MTTAIPPIVLSVILESKSSPETTVALLNETEAKYSNLQKNPHGNAKRVYPFWKVCQSCNKPFPTFNRTQAARNKTCGPDCAKALIGKANSVPTPIERRKGKSVACAVCGAEKWMPLAWLKRAKKPVCSRECNGVLRGAEWKEHAHKGRRHWKPESESALKVRMTGPTNPAWKGGLTYRKRKGAYADQSIKYVRCPMEFLSMARKDGYVMEHRLFVAQALGRPLLRVEVVHHRNRKATENQPINLMLFATNAEHKAYEHGAAIKPLWCGLCHSNTPERCGVCVCRQEPSLPSVAA
jgi:hypothetical protein